MSATDVVAEVERLIEDDQDSGEILQGAVTAIVQRGGALWAAVLFDVEGELILGPHAGVAEPGARRCAPIADEGERRGELDVDGLDDQELIDRVARALAPYCLPQDDLE